MTVLDHVLGPLLTPDLAARVAGYTLPPDATERLETLRAKANEGTLTASEQAEYEQFVESLDLLSVLQAKARAALNRRAS